MCSSHSSVIESTSKLTLDFLHTHTHGSIPEAFCLFSHKSERLCNQFCLFV